MMSRSSGLRYRRLLLKLSGEALMGRAAYGIDVPVVQRLSGDIRDAMASGAQVAVVVGGGNIFRGVSESARGMDRVEYPAQPRSRVRQDSHRAE